MGLLWGISYLQKFKQELNFKNLSYEKTKTHPCWDAQCLPSEVGDLGHEAFIWGILNTEDVGKSFPHFKISRKTW